MGRGALVKIASAKRVLLVTAGLAAIVGIGATVSAASGSPDFAVTASPHTASVVRGGHVQFNVAMTSSNGFHGAIALTVSGLPAGASGTFSSDPYYGDSHRILTVSTSSQASPGSSTLTITGKNGSLKHTAQVVLTTTQPATPGFKLAVSPSSRTVSAGSSGTYAVTITRTNFSAAIGFTVTGVPAHASATFSPTSTSGNNTTLTVHTASNTPLGSSTLTIKGQSGSHTATVTAHLSVTKPPAPCFKLAVAPANLNLSAGASGDYTVTITRTNLTGAIAFTVTGLPAHASATFSPTSTTGNTTTLTVHTASNTPLGSSTLTIKGQSGSHTATVTAHLTVSAGHAQAFTIAGSLDRTLAPDVTGYLDLALTNSNNQPLSITGLSVTITGTSKPACTTSNFAVTQFSGAYTFSVPANSTKTLSQLGIPQSAWPKVKMINLSTNQDACKSTSLALGYTGTGQGN